jgi:hypothetical protein
MGNRIGEIIEASTSEFVAQSYELYHLPAFGSLVKAGDKSFVIYAVVYNANTAGIEPGRRPLARGKDEPSEEAVYSASPQLKKLLKSEFRTLIVGWQQEEQLYRFLPPQPAHIHGFVYDCSAEEVKNFSASLSFLNILNNSQLPVPPEELISATLRQMAAVQADKHAFLVAAGKELAVQLCGQYQQLRNVLGRLQA